MKKSIILIIMAVVFMTAHVNAQETTTSFRESLLLGIKIGTNLSNVYDEQGEEFRADAKFGLVGGLFIAIPIGKIVGIQPEVLFSQKGFKATTVILGNSFVFTRTTSYIDVPLFLTIKPIESFTLLAGPQYAYLLKQRDVFSNGTTSTQQETAFENDNIRKNTLCFTGGFDINIQYIVLSARAGWDIQKNNGDGSSITPRYKNVWYQGTIGFRF